MAISVRPEKAPATRCRVLVVEDESSSRRALVRLLRLRGFETTFAATVNEALAQLDSRPTCVLLDLMLPDGSGLALLDHIHQHHLPTRAAVMTGMGDVQAALGKSRLRPEAVFTKPLNFDEVVAWLGR